MSSYTEHDATTYDRSNHLVEVVRRRLQATETPGATVAVMVDGQLVLDAGVGTRDLADETPLPAGASFYSYSTTKLLLSTIVLQHVAAGRLALDDEIQRFLPALPLAVPVTVRQLLNHTAGLPDYGGLPDYAAAIRADPSRPWSSEEFLTRTLQEGLQFAPGQGWAYLNIGFLLIRQLTETLTGQSFRAALARHITEPLGLQRTFVAETLADATALTPGYSAYLSEHGELDDIAPRYHPGWVSHGVVISTAADLAEATEAIFTARLFPADLLAMMLEPVLVPVEHALFRQPAYGLGVMLDPGSPFRLVAGHGGDGPGYSTGALHFWDIAGHRITTVALVNSDQSELGLDLAFTLGEQFANMPR